MNRNILMLILLSLSLLNAIASIGVTPQSATVSMYGGDCVQTPLNVVSSNETDVVAYAFYTISLEDSNGLSITGENPFILKKGETKTLPLNICAVSNFKPETFDLNFYVTADIEKVEQTSYVTQYVSSGGGSSYIYKDKNVFVDRNVIIQVPKEIIKEKVVEKRVEVPVEKIVTKEVTKEVPVEVIKENPMNFMLLVGFVLSIVAIIGIAGYFYLTKKGV